MQNTQNNVIEIDLIQLAKTLWSKALAIIAIALVCAIIGFAYTFFFIKPSYEADALFYVNNSDFSFGSTSFSISSGDISAANSLVGTYIGILEARETIEEVIETAGVDYTYEQVTKREMITAEAQSDKNGMFRVTVKSSSPTEAELIANTITQILPDRIAEIVDGSSVRIVDHAIVPSHRSSPSYSKNTVIAALLGGILACGIFAIPAIINQNDAVITTESELTSLFPDIPVIGIIPDMNKSGKNGYGNYYYSNYYAASNAKKG